MVTLCQTCSVLILTICQSSQCINIRDFLTDDEIKNSDKEGIKI